MARARYTASYTVHPASRARSSAPAASWRVGVTSSGTEARPRRTSLASPGFSSRRRVFFHKALLTSAKSRSGVCRAKVGSRSAALRSRGGASQQVSLPIENQAELVAERFGALLVDDVGARAEPKPLEEGRPEQGWAIVDREIVLRLVGRRLSRGRVDGIRAPGEVEVAAQARDQHLREVVGSADQPRFLVGLVEVLIDHREKTGKASPRVLDGVAGAGDGEGRRRREIAIQELDARPAGLRDPVLAVRFGQERVADRALVRDLGAEAEFPILV